MHTWHIMNKNLSVISTTLPEGFALYKQGWYAVTGA